MKIAFIHYTIGERCGVTSVMRTNIKSLLKIRNIEITLIGAYRRDILKSSKLKYINIPELNISKDFCEIYSNQDIYDYMKNGKQLYEKLNKLIQKYDAIIIENPIIGLHPGATYAFYMLAKRNAELNTRRKIIFRIHDFPEDRSGNFLNLLKFTGDENLPYWHKIIFPKEKNLGFIVINKKDIERVKGHGLIEKNKLFYLPNPVDENLLVKDKNISKKLRTYLIKKYNLKEDITFIYYPVRIVPRKNIEEAIFLTLLISYHENKDYCLLVSLEEKTQEGRKYAAILKRFIKRYKLNVIIGLNDCVTLERVKENGKIKKFGVGDAYTISDKIITTSLLEGFGMFFIESWFVGKSLIGRDLPAITSDFKNKGINLEHLYSALFVGKKDFKDFKGEEKLKLILKLKDKKFREKIYRENKHQLDGMFRLFNKEHEQRLIERNRKQVIKHFSSDYIGKRLLNIIKKVS